MDRLDQNLLDTDIDKFAEILQQCAYQYVRRNEDKGVIRDFILNVKEDHFDGGCFETFLEIEIEEAILPLFKEYFIKELETYLEGE